MRPQWKTGQYGNTQRAVCAPNGNPRAVAENTVTASVIVRALNEYDRGRAQTQRLVALRDAVERALTLVPEDIGTNVMPTEHLVEAREILAQAVRESAEPDGEPARSPGMVRVTISHKGLGGIFAPDFTIAEVPGTGPEHIVPPYNIGVRIDPA